MNDFCFALVAYGAPVSSEEDDAGRTARRHRHIMHPPNVRPRERERRMARVALRVRASPYRRCAEVRVSDSRGYGRKDSKQPRFIFAV